MFPLALNTFGDAMSFQTHSALMLKVILLSVAEQVISKGWRLFGAAKELLLYLGTAAGPTLFLMAIVCSNLYLLFVPVISTLLGQSETYDEAFKKGTVKLHKRGPPFSPATWPAQFCPLVYCPSGRWPTVCQNRLGHQNYYF